MKKIIGLGCAVIFAMVLSGCAAQDALRADQAQKVQDQIDQANAKKEAANQARLKKIRGVARPEVAAPATGPNSSMGVPQVPSLPSILPRNVRPAVAPAASAAATGDTTNKADVANQGN